jgi:predicted NAD/FAD-binding protein
LKIAVIGTGISGLASAWLLARRHSVTLYEKDSRPGGHTATFVTDAGQPVDTGFIVFTEACYPNLTALFRELEVPVQKTKMSFGVSLDDGAYEWAGSDNLFTVFAQWKNLFSPTHIRFLLELLKFNAHCRELLARRDLPAGVSLGEFLDREGYSSHLRSRYLLPMAGLIWSCSPKAAADYPADDFMRFFDAHGLFTTVSQPQWYSVRGGSHVYVKKMLSRFTGELRLNAGVDSIRRDGGSVFVTSCGYTERYDTVVCASHSDQALRMLGDASDAEREILSGIPYAPNRVILHTDESFLPKRRAAWSSWNYQHPVDEIHDEPISGSYWMNLLQSIPGQTQYVVTLNPRREPRPGSVLFDTTYNHPVYRASSRMTHARLPEIQGRRGVWFAGAWTGYGFHEDGLRSAVNVATALGCPPPWASGHAMPVPSELDGELAPALA